MIKMDKRWIKGLKCSKAAEIEFITESQTSTVWKQHNIVKQWTNAYNNLHTTPAGAKNVQMH